ncbi:MAG: hypothetical protein ACLQKA_13280 [Bryobacteraceae bacterium]
MKLILVFLAIASIASALPPAGCTARRSLRDGKPEPDSTCVLTPAPPSLLLGTIGMAGCGLLLARRRKARA